MDITITLTQTEFDALSHVAFSPETWINNAVHERCRSAIDDIVSLTVKKCLELNIQIPGTKDAMVSLAYAQGWVRTAAQMQAEQDAQIESIRASSSQPTQE